MADIELATLVRQMVQAIRLHWDVDRPNLKTFIGRLTWSDPPITGWHRETWGRLLVDKRGPEQKFLRSPTMARMVTTIRTAKRLLDAGGYGGRVGNLFAELLESPCFAWSGDVRFACAVCADLLDGLLDAVRDIAGQGATPAGEKKACTSANEARDRYCYEQIAAGKSLKTIMTKVKSRKQWESIYTEQGISSAAKRYAKRHKLTWPLK